MPAFPNDSLSRARRAGDAVIAAGGTQFEAALASIRAGFDKTSEILDFKRRVRHIIALGAGHERVRARYFFRLRKLRDRLEGWREANHFASLCAGISENPAILAEVAVVIIERWYRAEKDILGKRVLRELRLIARMVRRSKEYRGNIMGLLGFALGGEYAEAAE